MFAARSTAEAYSEAVRVLTKAEADLEKDYDEKTSKRSHILKFKKAQYYIATQLHLAVIQGDINAIKSLIECKTDINKPDAHGDGPLHLAAKLGNANVIRLLIEHQADINKPDMHGNKPLELARMQPYKDATEQLFIYNSLVWINVTLSSTTEAYSEAVKVLTKAESDLTKDYSERSKVLAKAESDLEKDDDSKTSSCIATQYHWAITHDDMGCIKFLIKHNTDINKPDARGDAPLYLAIKLGNDDASGLLIKQKAIDVNKPDARGDAPLRLAMMQDTKKISMDSSFGCTDGATAIREMETM